MSSKVRFLVLSWCAGGVFTRKPWPFGEIENYFQDCLGHGDAGTEHGSTSSTWAWAWQLHDMAHFLRRWVLRANC